MTARPKTAPVERSDAVEDRTEPTTGRNVGRRERLLSVALGGFLAVRGLRRRSLSGVATAALGAALAARGARGQSRLYRRLGVNTAASSGRSSPGASPDAVTVDRSVTVIRSPESLAEDFRDPDRLDRILGDAVTVHAGGERRQEWLLYAPFGRTRRWETELVEERPGELLRWESVAGASVPMDATVRFEDAPGDRGTEVRLRLRVDAPGGRIGRALLGRFGLLPDALVGKALYRFKSLAETGEIATLERNPSARGRGDLL